MHNFLTSLLPRHCGVLQCINTCIDLKDLPFDRLGSLHSAERSWPYKSLHESIPLHRQHPNALAEMII